MTQPRNLADAIRAHARARPGHSAIEAPGWAMSYRDLDQAVDAAAAALVARGIASGDHVGIGLGDRPAHLIYLFATARLGAVFVPVDCRWTAPEKLSVCKSFDVKLLVTDEDQAVSGIAGMDIAQDQAMQPGPAPAEVPSAPGGDQVLAIYLSSGTTGKPKGPVLTHANMQARFGIYAEHLHLSGQDRFASVTPLYFSAGRGLAMCMLYLGGTVVLLAASTPPQELRSSINGMNCTMVALVPTMIRRLLAERVPGRLSFPDVRTMISTGAPLNPIERQAAMEHLSPGLYTFYGASEGGGASVLAPEHPLERGDSAGKILGTTQVRIVDSGGNDLPAGATGRICYRSPATAAGYYKAPGETAATFPGGWFHPGDLGRIEDGFLYITGREKDMILRGGANVYPEEVERVLRAHPDVADVAVVGAPCAEFGEEIVAYVALHRQVPDDALLQWCRRELASYKVPRRFVRLAEIPKTPIGKADKAVLRSRAGSELIA